MYTINDNTKTIHRENPHEECNTDDATSVYKVDVDKLTGLLQNGYTYCLHCFDFLKPRANTGHPFEYQQPNPEDVHRIVITRAECAALYEAIREVVPDCAERTLAIRKLEECSMWLNKAIVFHGESYL